MRKGRCHYSAAVMIRTDLRLRDEAGRILRNRGSSLSAYIRDQLRQVVQEAADGRA